MAPKVAVSPSFEDVCQIVESTKSWPDAPNIIPLCASIASEFHTPSSIYLKVAASSASDQSFLLESVSTNQNIGRYSFVGAGPRKTLLSGPKHGLEADPLIQLSDELGQYRVAHLPSLKLPPLTGGAIGYVGYDCIKYFEPQAERPLEDVLELPESVFMLYDTIVAMDHAFQKVVVITYLHVPAGNPQRSDLQRLYDAGKDTITNMIGILESKDIPLPPQGPVTLDGQWTSNIGQSGYEAHVTALKKHIQQGNIIQAVPSQRMSRPTQLHPYNIYRHLRTINPSPYLFYLDCGAFQIVGASPEVLVKEEGGRIITHPIAGTVKRGATPEADEALAAALRRSVKDRAEHTMLVDLARNDVNRVGEPRSVRVDVLMQVQKFSHVQHLVSEVSGRLRAGCSRFDAFRSIFPAGTVSGAPKVRAMQLIGELEREKRGIYAGAVGYFGYDAVDPAAAAGGSSAAIKPGAMDTCIALRTMWVRDGVVYLQAGGGIVLDSDETDEYEETMNKLAANMRCVDQAERMHWEDQQQQQQGEGGATREQSSGEAATKAS